MCIAELNVSLQPCRHRWYHLSRPCSESTDLSNCPRRLGLAGWEIKCDFCPYCSGWNISNAEYRLVGNDRAPPVGGLARTPNLTLTATRRETRRGSMSRSDPNSTTMIMAQEKNRAMNARVSAYVTRSNSDALSVSGQSSRDDDEEDGNALTSSPSETSSETTESIRHDSISSQVEKPGMLKRMRHKSKRLSLNIFK